MNISEAFPSAFLQADDLKGKSTVVEISAVSLEEVGKSKDQKLVIAFRGKNKKLIANKTNAKTIAKLHGDDTEDWIGKQIKLTPREVEFQGDMVWAIRVSLEAPGKAQEEEEAPPASAEDWPEFSDEASAAGF